MTELATKWTYVVTATNIINNSLEVDTNLTPFYVTVLQKPGTEALEYADEEDMAVMEARAVKLAVKQADANWGTQWYCLEIFWIGENWGRGDGHYHNPQHWANKEQEAETA
tara:strand:+ start:430 stop:762 length:333 start_codon:yes stop_codon:yes gene_type:complete